MRWIGFAVVVTLSLMLAPLAADAQSAGKVHRIAYLSLQRPEGSGRAPSRSEPPTLLIREERISSRPTPASAAA